MSRMEKKAAEWLDLALKSKNLQKKLEYCTKYLELNPNSVDVWEYKADLLSLLGREQEVVDCSGKAYEKVYDELGHDLSVFYGLGTIHLGEKDEAAIGCFDKLLEKKPDYVLAWIHKGDALINVKRYAEAVACFDKALKLNPSKLCESNAWQGRGVALAGLGENEEAIKCCNFCLDRDLGNVKAWDLKARCLFIIAKYEEAILCCNEALEINPHNDIAKSIKEMAEEELKDRSKGK